MKRLFVAMALIFSTYVMAEKNRNDVFIFLLTKDCNTLLAAVMIPSMVESVPGYKRASMALYEYHQKAAPADPAKFIEETKEIFTGHGYNEFYVQINAVEKDIPVCSPKGSIKAGRRSNYHVRARV